MVKNRIDALEGFRKQLEGADVDLLREMVKVFAEQLMGADAADRWERFGVVPEQGFALLGQGRCLLGLSRPTEAAPILQHAREIFGRLLAAPALAETDALLQQASALSS